MKNIRKINFSPNLWGSHGWIFFGHVALSYPNNPTIEEKQAYKNFFMSIENILPCEKCSQNYKKHIQELPIDKFLDNRDTLYSWVVKMQNLVRKINKRPLLKEEEMKEKLLNPPKMSKKMKLIIFLGSCIGIYFLLNVFMGLKIKVEFKKFLK